MGRRTSRKTEMATNVQPEELTAKPGKLMTLTFSIEEGGDAGVKTKFHQIVSGRQMMSAMRTAVVGLIKTTVRFGEGFEMSEDDVLTYLFGEDK